MGAAKELRAIAKDPESRLLVACTIAARMIAGADGEISPEEETLLQERVRNSLGIDEGSDVIERLLNETHESKYTPDGDLEHLAELLSNSNTSAVLVTYAFATEMANADGKVDPAESRLLKELASLLGVPTQQATVLDHALGGQTSPIAANETVIAEIIRAFHPDEMRHFGQGSKGLAQHFAHAVNQSQKPQSTAAESKSNPTTLGSGFRDKLQQSDGLRIIEAVVHKAQALPREVVTLPQSEGLKYLLKRTDTSAIRIAVVGTFSTGKSTFLNALVGSSKEEIFPTSAIPCTAAINVLRYGPVPRYFRQARGGEEVEINAKDFRKLIELPEEMEASAAFRSSDIEALVVEYPTPTCELGVEFVDTPGLNEHPHRTEITTRYLAAADAVIVLLNANQLLSDSDRNLIEELAKTVKVEHLFFVVNYFDQVDEAQRDKVKRRASDYAQTIFNNPKMVESRLHFISAKQRLLATDKESEWFQAFDALEQSVGQYVAQSAGEVKWKRVANALMHTIANIYSSARERAEVNVLASIDAEINIVNSHIADIKRSRTKLLQRLQTAKDVVEGTRSELLDSVDDITNWFHAGLPTFLEKDSKKWVSEASPLFGKSQLVADYQHQLGQSLKSSIDWLSEEQIQPTISAKMEEMFAELDQIVAEIHREFARLEHLGESDYQPEIEEEGAFLTFMKGAGGWLAGGPVGAVVGATMEPKDLAINFAANFAAGFALTFMGVGLPFVLLGVAAIGITQLVMGTDKVKDNIRKKVLQGGLSQIDQIVLTLHQELEGYIHMMIDDIEKNLEWTVVSQIDQLESQEQAKRELLEEAKENKNRAIKELEDRKRLAQEVYQLGSSLENVGSLKFEQVLLQTGHDTSQKNRPSKQSPATKVLEPDLEFHDEPYAMPRRNIGLIFGTILSLVVMGGVGYLIFKNSSASGEDHQLDEIRLGTNVVEAHPNKPEEIAQPKAIVKEKLAPQPETTTPDPVVPTATEVVVRNSENHGIDFPSSPKPTKFNDFQSLKPFMNVICEGQNSTTECEECPSWTQEDKASGPFTLQAAYLGNFSGKGPEVFLSFGGCAAFNFEGMTALFGHRDGGWRLLFTNHELDLRQCEIETSAQKDFLNCSTSVLGFGDSEDESFVVSVKNDEPAFGR